MYGWRRKVKAPLQFSEGWKGPQSLVRHSRLAEVVGSHHRRANVRLGGGLTAKSRESLEEAKRRRLGTLSRGGGRSEWLRT